jgi:hypothetical protein
MTTPQPDPAGVRRRRRWWVRVQAVLGRGRIAANAGNDAGEIVT